MSNDDDQSGDPPRPPRSKLLWFVGTLVLLAVATLAMRHGSSPANLAATSRVLVGDVWLESTCLHWRLGTSRLMREPSSREEAEALAAGMEQLCASVPPKAP